MNETLTSIPTSLETGIIGIMHLKRYWFKNHLKKTGKISPTALAEEWNIDNTLLAALGLGLEQTIKYIYTSSTGFAEFENWVLEVNGHEILPTKIESFNQLIRNNNSPKLPGADEKQMLSSDDISFWEENGYIIIREAVSKDDCENTINAICSFIEIEKNNPATWYEAHPQRQGIMVQLFQHEALETNRQSTKIRKAYEQLWGRKDIWVNTDRCGFNPPETAAWKFPGPRLHWDVSLALPIPFGLQGILYLADTEANQGAFTLVPGFHNKVEEWLNSLPAGANARDEVIYALGTKPIAANAGDFIIWHQALPHGSSVNNSTLPRFVQYINYALVDAEVRERWV